MLYLAYKESLLNYIFFLLFRLQKKYILTFFAAKKSRLPFLEPKVQSKKYDIVYDV